MSGIHVTGQAAKNIPNEIYIDFLKDLKDFAEKWAAGTVFVCAYHGGVQILMVPKRRRRT